MAQDAVVLEHDAAAQHRRFGRVLELANDARLVARAATGFGDLARRRGFYGRLRRGCRTGQSCDGCRKLLHGATSTTRRMFGWIEHSTSTLPALSKSTLRLWPWAYEPRSKALASDSEKTLWANGSSLRKSIESQIGRASCRERWNITEV